MIVCYIKTENAYAGLTSNNNIHHWLMKQTFTSPPPNRVNKYLQMSHIS